MSLFSDLFNPSKKYDQAAQNIQAGITQGRSEALPILEKGQQTLTDYYGNAINTLQGPLSGSTAGGANLYADLTGANGPEGQARARAAFQTDPGYEFTKNEALQGVQRATGTGGFQDSGNVLTALQDRAAGLASQQYGNWAARLQPYLGQQSDIAKALAGVYGTAGGDITSQGNSIANLLYGSDTGAANAAAAALMGSQNAENKVGGQVLDLGAKLLGYTLGGPGGAAAGATKNAGNLFFGGGSPSGYGT
jgi:hypothetical protein